LRVKNKKRFFFFFFFFFSQQNNERNAMHPTPRHWPRNRTNLKSVVEDRKIRKNPRRPSRDPPTHHVRPHRKPPPPPLCPLLPMPSQCQSWT
jgi:hypothetical protein